VSAPAIRIDQLSKYYGAVIGVESLSLEIAPGEIFGFLGANGAGKTTTIRILLDLLRPSSGSATVLGFDCQRQSREVRQRIGYLPGEMPFYPELSGAGYLKFLAALGPAPAPGRIEFLLRRFNVSDVDLRRRMREYSQGMKRKLGIVQALMTDAPVLILDEPTSGLDPLMIEAFSETIDELAREGRATVFLSSHVLSEVDRTCQRIGVIRGGRLVAVRTLADLRASTARRITVSFAEAASPDLIGAPGITVVLREPERWVLDVRGPLGGLLARLNGVPVKDLSETTFTPEEAILRLFDEDTTC
jgi:ABC-2 type transport system ATP-binding protein